MSALRRTALAALALLLLLQPPASAKVRARLVEEYTLWADLGLKFSLWRGEATGMLVSETLNLGSTGYIYDPYLGSYSAQVGLTDVHLWGRDWTTLVGWNAATTTKLFPVTAFPVLIEVSHSAAGLAPGGYLPSGVSDFTRIAGIWWLTFPRWPSLRLEVAHLRTDVSLSSGLKPELAGAASGAYSSSETYGIVEMTYQIRGHSAAAGVALDDYYDAGIGSHRQRVGFTGADHGGLTKDVEMDIGVNGQIAQVDTGHGTGRARLSDYRALIRAYRFRHEGVNFSVTNTYNQTSFLLARSLSDDLVGEAFIPLRKWLTLTSGLATSVSREENEGYELTALREQAGLGAQLRRMLFKGPLFVSLAGRAGSTQVLGQGSGVLVGFDSNLEWSRTLHRRLALSTSGVASTQWDFSPLGSTRQSYVGIVRAHSPVHPRLTVAGGVGISHADQYEAFYGTSTAASTELTATTDLQYSISDLLRGLVTLGYAHNFSAGPQDRLYGGAQLNGTPLETLVFSVGTIFSTAFGGGSLSDYQFRADASVSWKVRRLMVFLNYQYRIDPWLVAHGGDHVIAFSVQRHFEVGFRPAQ